VSGYAFAVGAGLALVGFLVILLRTRRVREKYAFTWILVGLGICVLGAFPRTVEKLSTAVGVQTPSNLLFAVALIVLLVVCIQLSVEITSLEEETRTLVEEVALLRFDLERSASSRREETPRPAPHADEPPAPSGDAHH